MNKFSFRKDNSNMKSNVSIKDKTRDLLLAPFLLVFSVFYNDTKQKHYAITFPISHSTKQPSS